jgi:hypothetical protein
MALKGSKQLKSDDRYKNVYIGEDLSLDERKAEAKLRAERNAENNRLPLIEGSYRYGLDEKGRRFYYAVRAGKVVKITRTQQ